MLALGGLAVTSPAPTPGEAAVVQTAQRDGVTARTPAPQAPRQAPTRSSATQQAILKKIAHRDRARGRKSRGAWVPTKVGGRLAYFHKQ
jgi:hypothetical protein